WEVDMGPIRVCNGRPKRIKTLDYDDELGTAKALCIASSPLHSRSFYSRPPVGVLHRDVTRKEGVWDPNSS
ncbi:hypothetical protein PIB30_101724, partial [Stylosanthes scabra]|nr:hypothetical protein [Stylosanthes scabra]